MPDQINPSVFKTWSEGTLGRSEMGRSIGANADDGNDFMLFVTGEPSRARLVAAFTADSYVRTLPHAEDSQTPI